MKTEKEKMLSNELYNHKDAELTKERNHAYELNLLYIGYDLCLQGNSYVVNQKNKAET